jgi:hypothetical protein
MAKKVIPPTPAERTDPISAKFEGRDPDPVIYEGSIDQRLKALLKDHKEMGARPQREPATNDAAPNSVPLREVGTDGRKTVIAKDSKKK